MILLSRVTLMFLELMFADESKVQDYKTTPCDVIELDVTRWHDKQLS